MLINHENGFRIFVQKNNLIMRNLVLILVFLPLTVLSQTTNLLISEYGEGAGGNKKYIEIYNGTGAAVDLANYQLWRGTNGAAWSTTPLALTGTLANNQTYVIANNNVDVIGANLYVSTFIQFNGDDAIGLAWNGGTGTTFSLIDQFGEALGVDPGSSWTVAGNVTGAVDKILIRKPTVCSPTTNWALSAGTDATNSQWTIAVDPYNAVTQTTNLGMHTANCVTSCNTSASITITVCNSYTVPSGDATHTTSGVYMDTIPNAAACDSVLTINLTITTGITYYADADGDTFGNPAVTTVGCSQPTGYVTNNLDCNDTDNTIGIATTVYYQDADGDSFGSPTNTITACSLPTGYVTNNLDCNDADSTIHPNAIDIPDNGIDENCDGTDASSNGTVIGHYTFTQAASCPMTAISVTTQPTQAVFSDYSSSGTVCSPANNVFSASDWNQTSTIDLNEYNQFSITANNCVSMDINQLIFTHRISSSGGTPTWILRSSVDNFAANIATGSPTTTDKIDTVQFSAAFDALSTVTFRLYITNMGAAGSTWRNDNVRIVANFGTLTPQTFYQDLDGDGYGNQAVTVQACTPPANYVADSTDCNDSNSAINPATVWYLDADQDTYGDATSTFVGCTPVGNYVLNGTDCNDADSTIHTPILYYIDADLDGFGSDVDTLICAIAGAGYSLNSDDCDDTNASIYPGAVEIENNGIDENCDGTDNYLGLNTLANNLFKVIPNPSNGLFQLDLGAVNNGDITIVNTSGKLISSRKISSNLVEMDLSDLENGTYILTIQTATQVSMERIVIIH
jgi:hypothetical protein